MTVTLRRLKISATRSASGYDETFRETKLSATSDGIGESMRANYDDVDIPCQVEEKDMFEKLNEMVHGDVPLTVIHLTFHINDLKRLNLWEESTDWGGRPKLKKGDQVLGFKDRYGQQMFKTPENPGLFIEEVLPTGYLSLQNLIVCRVTDRSQGVRGMERTV